MCSRVCVIHHLGSESGPSEPVGVWPFLAHAVGYSLQGGILVLRAADSVVWRQLLFFLLFASYCSSTARLRDKWWL